MVNKLGFGSGTVKSRSRIRNKSFRIHSSGLSKFKTVISLDGNVDPARAGADTAQLTLFSV